MRTNLRTAVVAVVAILLLSGCSDGERTPSPATSPPTVAPTSEPDPEPATPAVPASRLPFDCDDLVPAANRAAFLGVPDSDLELFDYRSGEFVVAMRHSGALSCAWNGPSLGGENGSYLYVEVLAEAAAEFAQFTQFPQPQSSVDTLGPGSVVTCTDSDMYFGCGMDYLASDYWVTVSATGSGAIGGSSGGAAFAKDIATRLAAAGTLGPAFVPPADSLGAGGSCAAIDNGGAFRTSLGSPQLSAPNGDDSSFMTFVTAVSNKAARVNCVWGTPGDAPISGQVQQISLAISPGGAWGWEGAVSELEAGGSLTKVPVTVSHADRVAGFVSGEICYLVVDIDGSLVWTTAIQPGAPAGDPCVASSAVVGLARSAL